MASMASSALPFRETSKAHVGLEFQQKIMYTPNTGGYEMQKVTIEIDAKQIESVIAKLDTSTKWKIAKDIIKEQFKDIILEFRKTIKRKRLTPKKINDIVEQARTEFHAKSRG